MKKPNGYGSVYKLKDTRRRNPWVARKTVGFKDNGQAIRMFIGFYPTRTEAEKALATYNAKPYDKKTTFGVCADRWFRSAESEMSESTKRIMNAAAKRCASLDGMKIADIRLGDMQEIVDRVSASVGKQTRTYLSKVFQYAVRNEVIPADRHQIVSFVRLSEDEGKTIPRSVFTKEEIESVDDPLTKILLYTGLRVGEMLDLREEDIHLEERWLFVRRSKTAAGIRTVPICEKIVPCFSALPTDITYERFKRHFRQKYGHLPHDTRHTFISMCADKGIDPRVTKSIVGHSGTDITETVYTHIDLSVLLDAVNIL